jgi:D-alanyl-D-alanine carboxypeptidase
VVLGAASGGARNRYMMAMLDQAWPQSRPGKAVVAGIGSKAAQTAEASEGPMKKKRKGLLGKSKPDAAPEPVPPVASEPAPAIDAESEEQTSTAPEGTAFASVAADPEETAEAEEASPPVAAAPDKLPFAVKAADATNEGGEVIVNAEAPADDAASSTWIIQIGAFPNEEAAQQKLETAQQKAKTILTGKKAYTMEVEQDSGRVYRARFSGFSKRTAKAACKQLSAKGVTCLTLAPQS